jgi:hypothetical protein
MHGFFGFEKMKRIVQTIASGVLLFSASFVTISWPLSMLLWMFVLGDSHEDVWRVLPWVFGALSASIAIGFICLDFMNKTTRRSRMVRLVFSIAVCLLMSVVGIQAEVSRIKGWSAKDAALSVASSLYPELRDSFVLRVDSEEDVPSWTRGPNITYTVLSGDTPVCRLAVCRSYWSYWTCGMYETLRERIPNQRKGVGHSF